MVKGRKHSTKSEGCDSGDGHFDNCHQKWTFFKWANATRSLVGIGVSPFYLSRLPNGRKVYQPETPKASYWVLTFINKHNHCDMLHEVIRRACCQIRSKINSFPSASTKPQQVFSAQRTAPHSNNKQVHFLPTKTLPLSLCLHCTWGRARTGCARCEGCRLDEWWMVDSTSYYYSF